MRWAAALCCCLFLAWLFGSQPNEAVPVSAERQLTEFSNDDGTQPDGSGAARDDSSALQPDLNRLAGNSRHG